jgi:hypothetical protein
MTRESMDKPCGGYNMKRTPKIWRRTTGVLICIFLMLHPVFAGQAPQSGLRIVVVQGDRARNVLQQISAEPLAVRVEQGDRRPVAGATVIFTAPATGASGQFANGTTTTTITTDATGVASAEGFHPNGIGGNYSIQVRAQYQNQTAVANIRQSNIESKKGHKKLITFLFLAGAAAGAAYIAKTNHDKNSDTPSITFGDGAVGAPKP